MQIYKWCWPSALSDPPWIGGLSWISCTFPWKTTYLKSSACSNHSDWMWLASCSWNIVKHNCPWPNCSQPWKSNKCLQCPWMKPMKPVACAKTMVDSGPGGNHCFARIPSQWASMSRLSLPVTQAVALAVCLVALCPHFLGNKAGRCWELFIYEWIWMVGSKTMGSNAHPLERKTDTEMDSAAINTHHISYKHI